MSKAREVRRAWILNNLTCSAKELGLLSPIESYERWKILSVKDLS